MLTAVKNAFRSLKIVNKLFLMISFIMLLSLAFTFGVLQYAFTIYDEYIYEKSSQVLNLSSHSIEEELRKVERLSFAIFSDNQIQNGLQSLLTTTNEYERLKQSNEIVDQLVGHSSSEKYVQSIYLLDANGGEHVTGNVKQLHAGVREKLTAAARQESGGNVWLAIDNQGMDLFAVRQIRSFSSTDFELDHLGVLAIRVDLKKIVGDMSGGIRSQDGELMISSNTGVVFPEKPMLAAWELPLTEHENYRVVDGPNGHYFVSYLTSDYLAWTYYNVIPFGQMFERIITMKNIVIGFFAIIFALVLFWGRRFARSLTSPIEELIGRMKRVQKGEFEQVDLEALPTMPQLDEVGLLHRTFRLMLLRINELIKENYTKQLTIKETEFKALQAQINPHFLYNTLESINWLAKINKQTQISRMVEALGFLLRSSISLHNRLITVREELDIVKNYVVIQTHRYEERLIFELDIPDSLLDYCIPKLTLQPLLENAVHYALEPMIDTCVIKIKGWETEKGIVLVVEDNGPGMDHEFLQKVRRGEVQTKGKGIGLKNIEERIRLAFGDAYGVELESEPGKGTKVSIYLPREKGC
ncbi:sensor histidine kinase [Paenibacillus turpanensis]|uniref:sensor histidine kinase n=1 Tax=Paenibacillus turpanensis TaxID=2689078 RepID=UPI001408428D|nr:histidine kinase [Paenibacillus turpanensis]